MIQQREASYRLDKPIHVRAEAEAPQQERPQGENPRREDPVITDEAAASSPNGWASLADCTLAGTSGQSILVPLVLLHPEFGVALLGVPGAVAPAAEAALRQRLDVARFAAIFPGHLPVVALAVMPGEALNLQRRLAAAFATVPPLELAGGDGWVNVVRRALLSRSPIRLPNLSLPPDAEPYVPAAPHRRQRPRHWLWPLAGLTGVGVLVGLAVGLNHTPSDPGSGAEVPPRPVASAPPVTAAAQQPPPPMAAVPAAPPRRQAAPPAVEPPPPPALPRVLVRSGANLRTGPDSRAEVLRVAPRGEAFRVHGEARGGWVQVGDSEPRGWIHSSLLNEAGP